ncbi:ceramide glucosyltransferase [Geminicoccus flavidas]|uniref:ceramide glucosyltransferase n=1 Tax=Geminicoccus flavidas TaxID=2506407 RepID=UPI0013592B21|nr:ceramide glucosyltransferase [Geminicoccus flavidas]
MTLLDWAGAFCIAAIVVNTLSIIMAGWRCRPSRRPPKVGLPPVSIVRPLCGLDHFSATTLRSGFKLDHPHYELIYCVASASDPVLPLVRRLIAEHPRVPARVLVGDEPVSGNPKLNNCMRGWQAARHDWIVLADANVLMPPDYLRRLLTAWRADTGVVSSAPVGTEPSGFWAEVECAFLNSLQARWQYVGECLGLGFAQGKSLLFRRSLLDQAGGLAALGAEPAEDAAATKLVRRMGLKVHLVDTPFAQPLGPRTMQEVLSRQQRWARLRRATFPWFFLPEILTGPLLPLAAGCHAAGLVGIGPWPAAAAILSAWYLPELALCRVTGWRHGWRSLPAMLTRDIAMPCLWLSGWLGSDFTWRGSAMTVREARP